MSTRYCSDIGEQVDRDDCRECENEKCGDSANYKSREHKTQLDKLNSSDFAKDVMARLKAVFPLSENEIADHLNKLFEMLEKDVKDTIHEGVRDALRVRAAAYIASKFKDMLDGIFAEAVGEQIVALEKDGGKAVMVTIRERAAERIANYLNTQKNDQRRGASLGDPIITQIQSVVDQKVQVAIEEIKTEAIDRFNKETMKRMMAGMAKAISEDKRLLNLLTE